MRFTVFRAALLAALIAPVALSSQDQAVRIRAAKVLDGAGHVLNNVTIVVQGSKITSIGADGAGQGRPIRGAPGHGGARNSL
jgi:hypothetical protein